MDIFMSFSASSFKFHLILQYLYWDVIHTTDLFVEKNEFLI